ncbi:hypothetical protein TSOC_001970 [Tetrabaena socialis]|uniref:Secreted protein n=1 Tax=Tetrabaena socialis TaxID=47790 RepID=A0A2J8AFB3_9CHLO|nr:hypothetical protein TSOC_001970 [Tetrabaena socialis]|eukprot:PNH11210.1 hypothetical protein TSOC_001970 [Tetrabaena socialis]
MRRKRTVSTVICAAILASVTAAFTSSRRAPTSGLEPPSRAPMSPKAARPSTAATVTASSRVVGSDMKAPATRGRKAPAVKAKAETTAACRGVPSTLLRLLHRYVRETPTSHDPDMARNRISLTGL